MNNYLNNFNLIQREFKNPVINYDFYQNDYDNSINLINLLNNKKYYEYYLLSTYKNPINLNLGNSFVLKKNIFKYIYYKFLDKWVHSNYKVLKYFVIENNKVRLIKNREELNNNNINFSISELNKISDFIEVYFINKKIVKKILEKFCIENNYSVEYLPHKTNLIKKIIFKKLINNITKNLKFI